MQTGDKLAKPPFFVAYSRLCRHCRNLVEGGCRLSRFHFRLCRYFLGHVACRNLPWQGLSFRAPFLDPVRPHCVGAGNRLLRPRFETKPFGNENATEESEFALLQISSFYFISSVFQLLTNFPELRLSWEKKNRIVVSRIHVLQGRPVPILLGNF